MKHTSQWILAVACLLGLGNAGVKASSGELVKDGMIQDIIGRNQILPNDSTRVKLGADSTLVALTHSLDSVVVKGEHIYTEGKGKSAYIARFGLFLLAKVHKSVGFGSAERCNVNVNVNDDDNDNLFNSFFYASLYRCVLMGCDLRSRHRGGANLSPR